MEGIERIKILSSEVTDKALLKVVNYLLSREDMNEKYLTEEKSLSQMISFIQSEAKKIAKSGIAMVEDDEVYSWAIHYFDETNENLGINKIKTSKENLVEESEDNEEETQITNNVPKLEISKSVKKTKIVSERQLSLFDI